jgi:hypothetical protein
MYFLRAETRRPICLFVLSSRYILFGPARRELIIYFLAAAAFVFVGGAVWATEAAEAKAGPNGKPRVEKSLHEKKVIRARFDRLFDV